MYLFNYVGNKRRYFEKIEPLIPPHSTYIEPFLGSGFVFFNKKEATRNIINDLDKDLIKAYRLAKRAPKTLSKYNYNFKNIKQLQRFYDMNHSQLSDKLIKQVIKFNNGFSGKKVNTKVYKFADPIKKLKKNLSHVKDRLNGTTILNKDYREVINKYDSPSSFFFLDPPYEGSQNIYSNESMDFVELFDILDNLKGKFMLTLNDSKNISTLFKKFRIKKIKLPTVGGRKGNIGSKPRTELIIMNY